MKASVLRAVWFANGSIEWPFGCSGGTYGVMVLGTSTSFTLELSPRLHKRRGKYRHPKRRQCAWHALCLGKDLRQAMHLGAAFCSVWLASLWWKRHRATHPHANGLGRLGMGWGLSSQRSRWCMNNLHTVHAASIHLYTTTSFIAPTHPPTHPPHTDLDHAPTEPGACHRCLGRGSPRCLHGRGGALISISSSSSLYLPRGSNYGLFPCSSCAARMSLLLPARGIAAQRA